MIMTLNVWRQIILKLWKYNLEHMNKLCEHSCIFTKLGGLCIDQRD